MHPLQYDAIVEARRFDLERAAARSRQFRQAVALRGRPRRSLVHILGRSVSASPWMMRRRRTARQPDTRRAPEAARCSEPGRGRLPSAPHRQFGEARPALRPRRAR
jgi:hypothetical protein